MKTQYIVILVAILIFAFYKMQEKKGTERVTPNPPSGGGAGNTPAGPNPPLGGGTANTSAGPNITYVGVENPADEEPVVVAGGGSGQFQIQNKSARV